MFLNGRRESPIGYCPFSILDSDTLILLTQGYIQSKGAHSIQYYAQYTHAYHSHHSNHNIIIILIQLSLQTTLIVCVLQSTFWQHRSLILTAKWLSHCFCCPAQGQKLFVHAMRKIFIILTYSQFCGCPHSIYIHYMLGYKTHAQSTCEGFQAPLLNAKTTHMEDTCKQWQRQTRLYFLLESKNT